MIDAGGQNFYGVIPGGLVGVIDYTILSTDQVSNTGVSSQLSFTVSATVNYCTAGSSASGLPGADVDRPARRAPRRPRASPSRPRPSRAQKDGLFFFGDNGRQADSLGQQHELQVRRPARWSAPVFLSGAGAIGQCDGAFSLDMKRSDRPRPTRTPARAPWSRLSSDPATPFDTANNQKRACRSRRVLRRTVVRPLVSTVPAAAVLPTTRDSRRASRGAHAGPGALSRGRPCRIRPDSDNGAVPLLPAPVPPRPRLDPRGHGHRLHLALALCALAGFTVTAAAQTTWYVDDSAVPPGNGTLASPSASLQFAIAQPSTADGDRIEVADGLYVEAIDFLGKAIHVVGVSGAGSTTVDGGGFLEFQSAVVFQSGEGRDSVLQGFTITNGLGTYDPHTNEDYGGGIYLVQSNPTIANCVVTSNFSDAGAGIYGVDSSPRIVDTTVASNGDSLSARGGGIALLGGAAELERVFVDDNFTSGDGGGVWLKDGRASLRGCEISSNFATYGHGAGLYARHAVATLERCALRANLAFDGGSGGGLALAGGARVTAIECELDGNVADTDHDGGGAYITAGASLTYLGGSITNNLAADGGGVHNEGDAFIADCRIEGNTAVSFQAGFGRWRGRVGRGAALPLPDRGQSCGRRAGLRQRRRRGHLPGLAQPLHRGREHRLVRVRWRPRGLARDRLDLLGRRAPGARLGRHGDLQRRRGRPSRHRQHRRRPALQRSRRGRLHSRRPSRPASMPAIRMGRSTPTGRAPTWAPSRSIRAPPPSVSPADPAPAAASRSGPKR